VQDGDLYAAILGIRNPWSVQRVDLRLAEGEVHVFLEHTAGLEWACPECGAMCPLYDLRIPARRSGFRRDADHDSGMMAITIGAKRRWLVS
jgi:hypothetical protein